jgi:hypothetical protein
MSLLRSTTLKTLRILPICTRSFGQYHVPFDLKSTDGVYRRPISPPASAPVNKKKKINTKMNNKQFNQY